MTAFTEHERRIPQRTHRRPLVPRTRVRRVCKDDRPYAPMTYTIPGAIAAGDYEPMWTAYRPFYIARITASVGKHDDATHPSDGTPSGAAIKLNVRMVSADLSTDRAILASDDILTIPVDGHDDTASGTVDEFNVTSLDTGDHLYPRVIQVGSGRPGNNLQVTVWLVPVR